MSRLCLATSRFLSSQGDTGSSFKPRFETRRLDVLSTRNQTTISVRGIDAPERYGCCRRKRLDSTATIKQHELLNSIYEFARRSKELEVQLIDNALLKVRQRLDGHTLFVDAGRLQDILMRTDADGRSFVQVNFHDGLKILITDRLIGFKPVLRRAANVPGASSGKLPRVVTTPDLLSVLEAMEDAAESADRELSVLRELFDAIVCGAERVGFDVSKEKAWLLPYLGATPGFRANA